ncbi:hypothetical protein ACOME3_004333 [Neoechinorhynchus agilis]
MSNPCWCSKMFPMLKCIPRSTSRVLFCLSSSTSVLTNNQPVQVTRHEEYRARIGKGEYYEVAPPIERYDSYRNMAIIAAGKLMMIDIIRGLMLTLGYIFTEPVTINYPFEKGVINRQ